MTEYATFARFHSIEEANALITLLVENNIPYTIRQERNQLDSVIIGNSMDPMLAVNIPVGQFSEANKLSSALHGDAPAENYYPERLSTNWIVVGYIFSILSFVGLFAGLSIISSSKRLPDGRKVKIYDAHTITHGRVMLVIGIISTILWLLYRFEFPVNIGPF